MKRHGNTWLPLKSKTGVWRLVSTLWESESFSRQKQETRELLSCHRAKERVGMVVASPE